MQGRTPCGIEDIHWVFYEWAGIRMGCGAVDSLPSVGVVRGGFLND
jgi:hypothetical protein